MGWFSVGGDTGATTTTSDPGTGTTPATAAIVTTTTGTAGTLDAGTVDPAAPSAPDVNATTPDPNTGGASVSQSGTDGSGTTAGTTGDTNKQDTTTGGDGTTSSQQSDGATAGGGDAGVVASAPSDLNSGRGPPALWTVTLSDASGHNVTISADAASVVVAVDGTAQAKQLSDVTGLQILGGSGDDVITIDASAVGLSLSVDGGAGTDTLVGPGVDSAWSVTGAGSGAVGNATFAGFENLTGGANNKDTFTFAGAGSLSGVVEGGAGGFDSIVYSGSSSSVVYGATGPQSGTIGTAAGTITYAGMEPVTQTVTASDCHAEPAEWRQRFHRDRERRRHHRCVLDGLR